MDRTSELAALQTWLISPGRLAIILGIAGIGKTALAARAAGLWDGPVWYRKVYGFEDARAFAAALGDFLHRLDRPRLRNYLASGAFGADGLAAILREDIGDVLVVADDVHASSEVAGFLRLAIDSGSGGKILATARELPDALADPVRGGPLEVTLGGLDPAASRPLAAALLGDAGDRAGAIARAARGHPMALHILAGSSGLDVSADRVLEDAILEGLDPDLERAAAALGILRKPCHRAADLGVSASQLRRLARRGLVSRGPEGVGLHDLVAEVLLPRMPASILASAHRSAARAEARQGDAVEEAFHLAEAGLPRRARHVLLAAGPELLESASLGEVVRLLGRIPMNARARLLLAEALERLGRSDEARKLLEPMAGSARHRRRGEALLLLGRIASRRNSLLEAERALRESVAVAAAGHNAQLEGTARRLLALVRRKTGDTDGAADELDGAIALLESSGDPRERLRARLDRAILRLQRGDDAGAGKELEALLQDPGAGPREEAAIRSNLGIAWVRMSRPEDAARLFEESARAAERGGDFRAAGYALANAADAYLAVGRTSAAEDSLARARRVADGFFDPLLDSTILTNEGKVLAAQGHSGPAEDRLRAGVERIRGLGNVLSWIERVEELAAFYERAGRAKDAADVRREAEGLRQTVTQSAPHPAAP